MVDEEECRALISVHVRGCFSLGVLCSLRLLCTFFAGATPCKRNPFVFSSEFTTKTETWISIPKSQVKLQTLVYDIFPSRKVPESDPVCVFLFGDSGVGEEQGGLKRTCLSFNRMG